MPDPTGRISHIPEMHRGFSWKPAVRCATTANITISTALNAGDTIDGVTLAAGDRVLVKDQSTGAQNGIYIAGATPVRAADMDQDGTTAVPAEEIAGAFVYVVSGTTNGGTLWYTTNAFGGTIGSTSITWAQFTAGGGSSGLMWFNVMDPTYGAVNDGSTNDRTAINAAIAALNAAGHGVLYFPAGAGYKVTGGALTTITANGLVIGDGAPKLSDGTISSSILFDNNSAACFTVTGDRVTFKDLGITCVNASTPVSGSAGIKTNGSYLGQNVSYFGVNISKFYLNWDIQVGNDWQMVSCISRAPVLYGVKVQNTVNNDAGDWAITGTNFYASVYDSTAGLYLVNSGGGRVVSCKFNELGSVDSHKMSYGIQVAPSGTTTILLVDACTIENTSSYGYYQSAGGWNFKTIIGCEFGMYATSDAAIKVVGATSDLVIAGNIFKGSGTNAVDLATVTSYRLDGNINDGYTNLSTIASSTGFTNSGGLIGVQISGTPTSGDVPTATGATTATWQTPSSGSSLTVKDEGSTLDTAVTSIDFVGAGVTATNVSHAVTVTIPAGTGIGPIVISDTPSTPLVFADLIQNEAQDDLVYSDP